MIEMTSIGGKTMPEAVVKLLKTILESFNINGREFIPNLLLQVINGG